jgi:hypothetical protein
VIDVEVAKKTSVESKDEHSDDEAGADLFEPNYEDDTADEDEEGCDVDDGVPEVSEQEALDEPADSDDEDEDADDVDVAKLAEFCAAEESSDEEPPPVKRRLIKPVGDIRTAFKKRADLRVTFTNTPASDQKITDEYEEAFETHNVEESTPKPKSKPKPKPKASTTSDAACMKSMRMGVSDLHRVGVRYTAAELVGEAKNASEARNKALDQVAKVLACQLETAWLAKNKEVLPQGPVGLKWLTTTERVVTKTAFLWIGMNDSISLNKSVHNISGSHGAVTFDRITSGAPLVLDLPPPDFSSKDEWEPLRTPLLVFSKSKPCNLVYFQCSDAVLGHHHFQTGLRMRFKDHSENVLLLKQHTSASINSAHFQFMYMLKSAIKAHIDPTVFPHSFPKGFYIVPTHALNAAHATGCVNWKGRQLPWAPHSLVSLKRVPCTLKESSSVEVETEPKTIPVREDPATVNKPGPINVSNQAVKRTKKRKPETEPEPEPAQAQVAPVTVNKPVAKKRKLTAPTEAPAPLPAKKPQPMATSQSSVEIVKTPKSKPKPKSKSKPKPKPATETNKPGADLVVACKAALVSYFELKLKLRADNRRTDEPSHKDIKKVAKTLLSVSESFAQAMVAVCAEQDELTAWFSKYSNMVPPSLISTLILMQGHGALAQLPREVAAEFITQRDQRVAERKRLELMAEAAERKRLAEEAERKRLEALKAAADIEAMVRAQAVAMDTDEEDEEDEEESSDLEL